ncbi:MAG: PAS domain-containing protein, partial [Deltaproteobacteria bacterium]|nr:PAS domain-containing protein [Deltaproteobacteria bacterium]
LRNASGEPIGFRGMVRDRTEQKKAEQALRESEEKYRLLVENAHDGIYILQDGMVIFSNPRTEELAGYSSEELSRIPFIDLVHPKDRQAFLEGQQGKLEAGKRPSLYSGSSPKRMGKNSHKIVSMFFRDKGFDSWNWFKKMVMVFHGKISKTLGYISVSWLSGRPYGFWDLWGSQGAGHPTNP